jgi:hypothetical protein
MDAITGRPDHIEDVLIRLHSGQWFGWAGSNNKVYSGLEIYPVNGVTHPKPAKEFLESELAAAQEQWDKAQYKKDRKKDYGSIGDQLDMQYHDSVNGTTVWQDHIAAVKAKYPKP